jgi:2-oxoglutarate dehydrogenase E2 component (dihydrolipoamide succinyltransferase)
MSIEIKTPAFPESISEGEIATWNFAEGDAISEGDIIVEIETDKVVMEVPAVESGVMGKILKQEGDTVASQEIIGSMEAGTAASESSPSEAAPAQDAQPEKAPEAKPEPKSNKDIKAGPSARREIKASGASTDQISGSGVGGRVTKSDVKGSGSASSSSAPKAPENNISDNISNEGRIEKRVPMSRLRKTIANRLLSVQQNSAILTTFNEVDMHAVKSIRAQYKDSFIKKHDTKLGFMSFFVKAVVEALKRFPDVNASIDGTDMIYHGYFDISIAVSSPRGLVVPVIRNADKLSFAQIEKQIIDYAVKARDGSLSIEDMQGGTFTITNGGTFGSMLSTPIINAPQSAILGMHNIVDRPMVVDGEIKIRPIMYLALSYDHRIIDGKDSVSFLRTIKELLEDPARLLLEV